MSAHVKACIAEAEAAGWSGAALQRLVIDPKSETMQGFRAQLANANEIRALIKFGDDHIRAAGQDPEGAAEYFVSQGYSLQDVREGTLQIMVEADEKSAIDTARPVKKTADPYEARAAEIDEHKAKTRG